MIWVLLAMLAVVTFVAARFGVLLHKTSDEKWHWYHENKMSRAVSDEWRALAEKRLAILTASFKPVPPERFGL